MLDSGGATAAVYRKMHLVPFGEYVPFKDLLFFVKPLVEAVSDFSPGQQVTMLPVNGHMASTAICYEVTYPALMREGVRQGSELLTTITNDAWYGESSAPFQHFEMADDARDRAGPLSRARGQHRHHRHRGPLRPRAGADAAGRDDGRSRARPASCRPGPCMPQWETASPHAAIILTVLALAASFRRPWPSSSMN